MRKKLTKLSLILFTLQILLTGLFAQDEQKAELVVQTGHSGTIYSIAYSPDGKLLASGDKQGIVKLWDVKSGKELRTLATNSEYVTKLSFSPDGKTLFTGSISEFALWNVSNGIKKHFLKREKGGEQLSLDFNFALNIIAEGQGNGSIKLINVANGEEVKSLKTHSQAVANVTFSESGKFLASGGRDDVIKIWNVSDGEELKTLVGHSGDIWTLSFDSKEKTLLSGSQDGTVKLWDIENGHQINSYIPKENSWAVSISPDGSSLASGNEDNTTLIWNLANNEDNPQILQGHSTLTFANSDRLLTGGVFAVKFSPDGKTLATGGSDGKINIWNLITGKAIHTLEQSVHETVFVGMDSLNNKLLMTQMDNFYPVGKPIQKLFTNKDSSLKTFNQIPINENGSVAVSPDGEVFAINGSKEKNGKDETVITDAVGKILFRLDGGKCLALSFSPDNKTLATGCGKNIKLWDIEKGIQIQILEGHSYDVWAVGFTKDGKTLISASGDQTIRFWDIETGKQTQIFENRSFAAYASAFSSDGKLVASVMNNGQEISLWNIAENSIVHTFKGHSRKTNSVIFSSDDKKLISSGNDGKIKFWNIVEEKEIATLTVLPKDWAITTPDGLFDASPNARKLMHYVVGLEVVTLEQMKDIYYVPGLLKKIINGDPLPKVELFSEKDLFPEVEFSQPKAGQKDLTIKLKNRGGGIGQVQVLVNGNEIVADARTESVRKNQNVAEAEFTVSLENAPFITGKENRIEVVARNISGSLTNRGTSRGVETFMIAGDGREKPIPNFYIIAGGISDYTGDNLDLSFAAKDAEDFAKALELGAVNLPGVGKSKVHIRLLTSNGDKSKVKFDVPDAKITTATKADFQKAFADFSGATTDDVFIVYLAGHGISLSLNQDAMKAGGNTYLYLTQEATTTDRSFLILKQSREAMTVSSDELKDLMKQNNALKKVLILDTCAAGAVSTSFLARNDLPADQILAMEQLKDSMGFYILMGSSADSVSYEANEFGQGLLTYSLLSAFKGGKLSGENAKIDEIFAYAKQEVPNLAKNIGGIQQPKTITPEISDSFTIGRFTEDVRAKITLASPRPVYVRPSLRNAELKYDNLKLTKMLTDGLRAESYAMKRGEPSRIAYFEADEITDAIQPVGDYTIEGDTLKISVILVKNNLPTGKKIVVTGNVKEPEKVIAQLVVAVIKSGEVK